MIKKSVESLATDTPTVSEGTSAMAVAGYLRRPDVPAVVVEDEDALTGVVTESDVVAVVAEGATDPPAGSFMSSPVVTIPPGTEVGLAADRMRDAGVGLLPVVDDRGAYRGVVTKEVLAPYLSRHRLEVTWKGDPLTLGRSDGAPTDEAADGEESDALATE